MKRVLTMLLAVAVLMGTMSAYTTAQVAGDANGDGAVNNRDLGVLQRWLNGWSDTVSSAADVDGDGAVNNRDMGALQVLLTGGQKETRAAVVTSYINLGAPAADYYDALRARCAWDMIIHDGRLYVGSGDYDWNTGGAVVLSCPVNDAGNWTKEATLPDEQVGRFIDYNGVLTIPGFDPVGDAPVGTYYEKIGGRWQTVDTLPYALHNFDLLWFEGQLFASVGSPGDQSPVVVTDDGVNYRGIPMYKDGEPLDLEKNGVARSMNLYLLDGTIYADFWYQNTSLQRSIFEMYRYDPRQEILEFVADMKTNTHGGLYSPAGLPLWEKEALGDKMFLTTGYLYYTMDFEQYTEVAIPGDAVVYDMMEYDGRLYILAATSGTQYRTTIYSVSAADPTALRTEATFSYRLAPTSFAVDADNFFIGMGNWYNTGSAGNGTILQMER